MAAHEQIRRLEVTDVRVIERHADHYDVQFDLSWREAFRDGEHWNAAWVFLKVKPSETIEVESADAAIETLTDEAHTHPDVPELLAHIKADVERGLAVFDEGPLASLPAHVAKAKAALANAGPAGPGPRGPGLPPLPRALRRAGDRLAERLAEGAPAQQTDEDAAPGHDPALAPGPHERDKSYPERLPQSPLHAFRIRHSRVVRGGQQVEVDEDFAFLCASEDGQTKTITRFTHWRHMPVSTDADHHRPPKGVMICPSEDGMGVFIYRDSDARGPLELSGVRLRTTLVAQGQSLKVWVGALEMVHVPGGEFNCGDPRGPQGPTSCLFRAGTEGQADRSYPITSEAEIPVGETEGQLCWNNKGQMGELGNVPAAYPKGHRAFYLMKHQVTQGEYSDFINHLEGNQITIRYPYGGQGDYRYTVYKTYGRPRVCTRPERASNWASWVDARAYIWWTGLRPPTELEYEKAARGPAAAIADEYAWGSTNLVQSLVILGDETDRPIVQGNCNIGNPLQPFHGGDGGQGPVPDDAFRATRYQDHAESIHLAVDSEETYTWREETGGSYYEIMGLSGNLWEFVVTLGTEKGRRYVGEHGDGNLDPAASPSQPNTWPNADNSGVGFRGGSWYTKTSSGRIADRGFGSGLIGYQERSHDTGIRAARTAPENS